MNLISRCLATGVAMSATAISSSAVAQSVNFNVPAQDVASAVREIARQANVQIMVSGELAQGRKTRAISGTMTVEQALQQMLAGSGLTARPSGEKTYVLVASQTSHFEFSGDPIIVTAQKREQTLLEVPSSVLALSGEQLRDSGVSSFIELAQQTPGVIVSSQVSGGRTVQTFTIRGIGNDDPRPNGNPSAAVHFDGVYQGSSALIGGQMFDVQRVEILKGPQGTLYGRNTTAGAINVISRKPERDLGGSLDLEYGRFDSIRAEGAINLPLAQDVALRVSGVYDRTDGYYTNTGAGAFGGTSPDPTIPPNGNPAVDEKAGKSTFYAGRALLAFDPGTGTEILVNVHGFHEKGGLIEAERSLPSAAYSVDAPYTFSSNVVPYLHKENYGASLNLTQDVGESMQLAVVGGYEHLKQRFQYNDGFPIRLADADYRDWVEQGSIEMRLQNKQPSSFNWVIGGSFFKDRVKMDTLMDGSDAFRTVFANYYRQKRESWAIFGDTTINLTERLKLGLGMRYTWEDSHFSGDTLDLDPYGLSIRPFSSLPVHFSNPFSDSSPSGKASLSYSISEDAEIYASIGRGFKAGGFDGSAIWTAPEALPFKSEKMTAYEVGVKFLPRNGPVHVEVSAYYYDYSDMQANSTVESAPGVFTAMRTNVGKARVYGGELSVVANPVRSLEIRLGSALVSTEITDFISGNPLEVSRRTGNNLPFAPAMTLNGSIRHEIPISEHLTLTSMISGRFVTKYYTEMDNFQSIGDYFLGNAKISLNIDNRWSIGAYARNFTDSNYATGLLSSSATVKNTFRGEPRSYGITAGVRF